ncbi:unnamed protein product, partial [Prunus brigantina]
PAKKLLVRSFSNTNRGASTNLADVPKGILQFIKKQRFIIPISFLNQPAFQELLSEAEEEFGFDHPTGGLTIPCRQDAFLDVISHLNSL